MPLNLVLQETHAMRTPCISKILTITVKALSVIESGQVNMAFEKTDVGQMTDSTV